MIFVTVGTHEQQFDRLIRKVDELKRDGAFADEVVMQTGFCTYEPQYCRFSRLIPYQDMVKNVAEARIVITHGGPASFIMPLQIGKIPIVVPRQKQFEEHVNDHQLEFARNVAERMGTSQSAVARLESGKAHPSVATLEKLAEATGSRLRIALEAA